MSDPDQMSNLTPFSFFLVLISPAIGSFLAVLADRLPRGEDVLLNASRCRHCNQRLTVLDLIPILSFTLSRGRCRSCGGAIPPWLLYTEILAIGAAVLAVLAGGDWPDMLLSASFLWLLIALGLADLHWFRLPNPLTAGLAIVACLMALRPAGLGWEPALWGAVWGAGSFYVLRWGYQKLRGREGLGMGDVKLMVGLGAFAGVALLPALVLLAASTALGLTLVRRRTSATTPLPFGAALCAAGAALWLGLALGF